LHSQIEQVIDDSFALDGLKCCPDRHTRLVAESRFDDLAHVLLVNRRRSLRHDALTEATINDPLRQRLSVAASEIIRGLAQRRCFEHVNQFFHVLAGIDDNVRIHAHIREGRFSPGRNYGCGDRTT
jgi:hypothetical protein